MERVFRFKSWFLNAPGLIHGGAYYWNFILSVLIRPLLDSKINYIFYTVQGMLVRFEGTSDN